MASAPARHLTQTSSAGKAVGFPRILLSTAGSLQQRLHEPMTEQPPKFRFIGQPIPRTEDARLLTGRGQFSDDFCFPGQTYAAIVRSPHAHARITRIDATAAKKMPGVLGVFTGEDCLADKLGPSRMTHCQRPSST